MSKLPLLQFEEAYFERLWGGTKLRSHFSKPTPEDRPIGEAWLVADHASHESRIAAGPFQGSTLHDVLLRFPCELLGKTAQPTSFGRFPLLLKLLDSSMPLSVQVHPDDAAALRLGEPDVGKTEMWHVIQADPEGELICGLDPALTKEDFTEAALSGGIESYLGRFPAPAGTSVFVEAGTVHAIGAGFLIAEIQQNSDLTYRIYDWQRRDRHGATRELHLEKARAVASFGVQHPGAAQVQRIADPAATRELLCSSRYFAAERITVSGKYRCPTGGRSFHLLLSVEGTLSIFGGGETRELMPGAALLVPGEYMEYGVSGVGSLLDYYVPEAD